MSLAIQVSYMGFTKNGRITHLVPGRTLTGRSYCGANVTRLIRATDGELVPFADHWNHEDTCPKCVGRHSNILKHWSGEKQQARLL